MSNPCPENAHWYGLNVPTRPNPLGPHHWVRIYKAPSHDLEKMARLVVYESVYCLWQRREYVDNVNSM